MENQRSVRAPRVERRYADPAPQTGTSRLAAILIFFVLSMCAVAQRAPEAPDRPWSPPPPGASPNSRESAGNAPVLDPAKVYTLPELINVAEGNNPDTRVAWQNAK